MTSTVLAILLAMMAPSSGGATVEASTNAALGDLAWMAGRWIGESNGVRMEEYWIEPKGGLMLGLHRDIFGSGKAFFEYLRIESSPEGIVYQASPGGRPATPFHLTELRGQRVLFSNPEHDFPQRIIYWREGEILHARIEGDTAEGVQSREWTYRLEARHSGGQQQSRP